MIKRNCGPCLKSDPYKLLSKVSRLKQSLNLKSHGLGFGYT